MFTIGKINIDLPVNDNKHWDEKLENNMGDGGDGHQMWGSVCAGN